METARQKFQSVEVGSTRLKSNGHGGTYRMIKTFDGWKYEHRVVAELKTGKPLRKGEVVHHDDLDKLNNDPRNLIVMTREGHSDYHYMTEGVYAY